MITAPAPALPVDLGPGPFAVTTRGLSKRYGSVAALDGLDLQLPEGAVYVLVGENGAGKSTLLRVLMGLTHGDAGAVDVLGKNPRTDGGEVRARIGYVPEDHDLGYPWMTVGRLIEHHRVYRPAWDEAYGRRLLEAYEIDPARRCRALSKGQRRRVQLLLALAHRPPLLLLDEPTDGLDHVVRDATLALLSEHLADRPTTVLISTHRVYEVERLVDTVGVLSSGRLLSQLFTAATAAYLLVSALTLGTERPWLWAAGAWLLFLAVGVLSEEGAVVWFAWLEAPFRVVLESFDVAASGGIETLRGRIVVPGDRAIHGWWGLPSFGRWATATAGWLGLGLVAVWTAARRHREG